MTMSLLQLLRKRMEIGHTASIDSVVKWLPRVTISLDDIMDTNRQLLEGHVVMGFTRQGAEYVLSYQLRIDYEDADLAASVPHYYSLHWWKFDPIRPLKHAYSVDVFKDQLITKELQLTICLPQDNPWVIVHGYDSDGCRSCVDPHDCYVSIIPSPVTMDTDHTPSTVSITLTYLLHSPMPMFKPSLCLEIENCVLINSGCGLYIVSYDNASSLDEPHPLQSHQSESSSWLDYTDQWFASDVNDADAPPTNDTLDITVHRGDELLSLVGVASGCGLVRVCQWSFDIESWLYNQLNHITTAEGGEGVSSDGKYSLRGIVDYDLRILEVYGSQWVVVFVVIVTATTSSPDVHTCTYCTVTLYASWDVRQSTINLISHSKPCLSTMLQFYPKLKPGLRVVSTIQKKLRPYHTPSERIQTFTNCTVFSGKSLLRLDHPYLPLSLKMSRHNHYHVSSSDDISADSNDSIDHSTYYYNDYNSISD